MNIVKTLSELDYFRNLNKQALSNLSHKALYRELEAREVLFHEGFEGTYFYILLQGSIRIFKTSAEGKESTIKIIHPGEFFAEAVLFKKSHYPATAIATEKSALVGINRDSFSGMFQDPESRSLFLAGVFEKLRFLSDQIHYLTSHDVEDRFFVFLIRNYGKQYRYTITLPKKDMASAIGTIPETFSRLIVRLTNLGVIVWKKNILTIKEGFWEMEYNDE
jgi:CRP-like cAMP-binding protein